MADGSVVVVEIQSGTLARVSPTVTSPGSRDTGGGPNGAAIGPDGKVYVCNNGGFEWAEFNGMTAPGPQPADYIGGRIQRVDIDTGEVEDLYTECDGSACEGRTTSCSTTSAASTSPTWANRGPARSTRAGVYYAAADGSSIENVVYGLDHANGIAPVTRRQPLYVAETMTGRLWSWDIESPGVFKPGTTPPRRARCTRLRRLPAPRLDGRRQRGKRLRRHPRHRGDQRDQPRGQAGRADHGARSTTSSSRTSASAGPTSAPRTSRLRASGCSTRRNGRCPACGSATTHSPRASRDSHRGVPGPIGVLSSPLHSSQGCGFCA